MTSINFYFERGYRVEPGHTKISLATIALLAIISLGYSRTASAGFTTQPAGLCYVNDVEATTYITPGDAVASHCGILCTNTTQVEQSVWVCVEIRDASGNLIVDNGETIPIQPGDEKTVQSFAQTMVGGYYGERLIGQRHFETAVGR